MPTQKTTLLLGYLALENGRPHARTRLAALFWPDHSERDGRNSLRQALAQLRKVLEEREALHPVITATRSAIRLDLHERFAVDLLALLDVAAAVDDLDDSRLHEAIEGREAPLLDGLEAPEGDLQGWIDAQRSAAEQAQLRVLGTLARRCLAGRAWTEADALAVRQLAVRQTHEPAFRVRMEVAAAQGRREAALLLYEQCHEVLLDTLGVRPSEETRVLHRKLVADDVRPVETSAVATANQAATVPPLRRQLGPRRPLFGREDERALVLAQLQSGRRLITLQGPGGIGKTRLAESIALAVEDELGRPVLWVPLATATTEGDLAAACLDALGAPWPESATAEDALVAALPGTVLLVLDEVEALVRHEAHVDLLPRILGLLQGLTVLATSRAPLRLSDEQVLLVEGLGTGDSAAALLRSRAADINGPGHGFSDADVAAVCEAVHGVPLALELAARLTRTLALGDLARLLPTSPELLRSDAFDGDVRHSSLEAVFDSTWSAISRSARTAASRCAVFERPFTLEAARTVAGLTPALLAELIDASLVRQVSHRRYGLHSYLRELCARQLAELEPDLRTRQRHTEFFCERLATQVLRAYGPVDLTDVFTPYAVIDTGARDALIAEHADLSRAVEDRIQSDDVHAADTVVTQWWIHLGQRGRWIDAESLLERALQVYPPSDHAVPDAPQALWTLLQGDSAISRFAVDRAIDRYERALALLGEPVPPSGLWRRLEVARMGLGFWLPTPRAHDAHDAHDARGSRTNALKAKAAHQLVTPYVTRAGMPDVMYAIARSHRHVRSGPVAPGVHALALGTAMLPKHFAGATRAFRDGVAELDHALTRVDKAGNRARALASIALVEQFAGASWERILERFEEAWDQLPAELTRRGFASDVCRPAIATMYIHGDLDAMRRWVDRGLAASTGGSPANRVPALAYDANVVSFRGDRDEGWRRYQRLRELDRRSGRVDSNAMLVTAMGALLGSRAGVIDEAAALGDQTLTPLKAAGRTVSPWTTILAFGPACAWGAAAARGLEGPPARVDQLHWASRQLTKLASRLPHLEAHSLLVQGHAALLAGRIDAARERWKHTVEVSQARDTRIPGLLAAEQLARLDGSGPSGTRSPAPPADATH